MRKGSAVLMLLVSSLFVLGACTKTLDVSDLELEPDLTAAVEDASGQKVTDIECPEEIEDPKEGTRFSCDVTVESGQSVTIDLELKETEGGELQAHFVE